ncbi:YppG family protein [Virgibacillus sp. W0181]|uniref:YppG family protein n=1 Tax=Virgibacillus sp. W0181 TaxID=3391581 RepID=UPI003F48163F
MYRYAYEQNPMSHFPNQQQTHYSRAFFSNGPVNYGYPPYGPPGYHQPFTTPFEYYAKPEQQTQWPYQGQTDPSMQQGYTMNRPNMFTNPFQNENGQLDVNKMMATVGQFASTVQQISPVIKQVGDMVKTFR